MALGRGLAGILDEPVVDRSSNERSQYGLDHLVGGEPRAKAAELRSFVVDTALAVVTDAFGLDGLILVGGAGSPTSRFLASRLPPSWSIESPALFEVYGRLHAALAVDGLDRRSAFLGRPNGPVGLTVASSGTVAGGERTTWQASIGKNRAWFARLTVDDHPAVAVAVRASAFSESESDALGAVIASVVTALSDDGSEAARRSELRSSLSVSVDRTEVGVSARVEMAGGTTVPWLDDAVERQTDRDDGLGPALRTRHGSATATDAATAVARAAAALCGDNWEIMFAGCSAVDRYTVSIVIVGDDAGRLRMGFAVSTGGDPAGAAEAVLTALR